MLDVVTALAWGQHGAFSTAQAAERGVSRTWLVRHCTGGTLRRRAQGVYALAAAPETARQRLMVHVLAAGPQALATGDSALGLWCPELVLPRKPAIVGRVPTVGVARALLDASVGRSPRPRSPHCATSHVVRRT